MYIYVPLVHIGQCLVLGTFRFPFSAHLLLLFDLSRIVFDTREFIDMIT